MTIDEVMVWGAVVLMIVAMGVVSHAVGQVYAEHAYAFLFGVVSPLPLSVYLIRRLDQ